MPKPDPPSGPSDRAVGRRDRLAHPRGDTPLFEVLMRRHNERLYRAARAIVRDEYEAEDVMQEAYVNAYTHLAQFDGRAKFSTWLTKIAVYERSRARRRAGAIRTLDDPPGDAHADHLIARSRTAGLWARVGRAHRVGRGQARRRIPRSVHVRQVEGSARRRTAEVLGLSEDAVKTRFSRARNSLQQDLLDRTERGRGDARSRSGRLAAIASWRPCFRDRRQAASRLGLLMLTWNPNRASGRRRLAGAAANQSVDRDNVRVTFTNGRIILTCCPVPEATGRATKDRRGRRSPSRGATGSSRSSKRPRRSRSSCRVSGPPAICRQARASDQDCQLSRRVTPNPLHENCDGPPVRRPIESNSGRPSGESAPSTTNKGTAMM